MILHNSSFYGLVFGDKNNYCVKSLSGDFISDFAQAKNLLNLKKLVFLNQTHSINGLVITDTAQIPDDLTIFKSDGDFLITNLPLVGIGVRTADCLSILIFDKTKKIVCAIHAGWRGAVGGIIQKVFEILINKFESDIKDLEIYLGPCAKSCCYEVDEKFLENLQKTTDGIITQKNNKIYFNLPKFAEVNLLDLGVKSNQINQEYNLCTICTKNQFCSYRLGDIDSRQMSIIFLK